MKSALSNKKKPWPHPLEFLFNVMIYVTLYSKKYTKKNNNKSQLMKNMKKDSKNSLESNKRSIMPLPMHNVTEHLRECNFIIK